MNEIGYYIHEYLPFIIFLFVLPVSLYLRYRKNQTNRKKLKQAALALGLQYNEKASLSPSINAAAIRSGDQIRAQQRLRQMDQGGFLSRIATMMSSAALTGKYNGFEVDIRTADQNKKTYTVFSIWFPAPLGLGLRITGNSFFRRDLPFGSKPRIESGSDEFDKKLFVKGNDEMRVKFLVKRPEVQKALLDAYRAQSDTVIDDTMIVCRVQGFPKDSLMYQTILNGLTAAARQLGTNY